jgi:DNA primase
MSKRQPAIVEDVDGDVIEVSADHCGMVRLRIPGRVVDLDAAKQEEFAQAYVAACHEAKALAESLRLADAHGAVT